MSLLDEAEVAEAPSGSMGLCMGEEVGVDDLEEVPRLLPSSDFFVTLPGFLSFRLKSLRIFKPIVADIVELLLLMLFYRKPGFSWCWWRGFF